MPRKTVRDFAVRVVERLRAAGFRAYWAGGCVRDLLLGKAPKDYDVATDARPEQVIDLFGPRRTRAVGAAFGVILVHGPDRVGDIEVATFRTEGPYFDGRRPASVQFCTAEEDAQRRDFTINGMYYDPVAHQVLDFVGGQIDLQAQIVRAIGDPFARFREDKLRMLRAIRFTATLDFSLDAITQQAVTAMSGEIHAVSVERIAQEWKRMLTDAHRAWALELARRTGLLSETFPELGALAKSGVVEPAGWPDLLAAARHLEAPSFELALATLLQFVPGMNARTAQSLGRRLRLSNQETDRIAWLISARSALQDLPRKSLAERKQLLAHPGIQELFALEESRQAALGSEPVDVQFARDYLALTPPELLNPPLLLTGDDLIRHGFTPGPQFKRLLDQIREAQLNGVIQTPDEALHWARQSVDRSDR